MLFETDQKSNFTKQLLTATCNYLPGESSRWERYLQEKRRIFNHIYKKTSEILTFYERKSVLVYSVRNMELKGVCTVPFKCVFFWHLFKTQSSYQVFQPFFLNSFCSSAAANLSRTMCNLLQKTFSNINDTCIEIIDSLDIKQLE